MNWWGWQNWQERITRIQIKHTVIPDNAPSRLAVGELAAELNSEPNPRLWVGVPLMVDPTGRRLLAEGTIPAGAIGPKGGVVYKAQDGSLQSGVEGSGFMQLANLMIQWGEIAIPNPGGGGWVEFGPVAFPGPAYTANPSISLTPWTGGSGVPDSNLQGEALLNTVNLNGFDGYLRAGTNAGGDCLAMWMAFGYFSSK